jgi:hypothetical protein
MQSKGLRLRAGAVNTDPGSTRMPFESVIGEPGNI